MTLICRARRAGRRYMPGNSCATDRDPAVDAVVVLPAASSPDPGACGTVASIPSGGLVHPGMARRYRGTPRYRPMKSRTQNQPTSWPAINHHRSHGPLCAATGDTVVSVDEGKRAPDRYVIEGQHVRRRRHTMSTWQQVAVRYRLGLGASSAGCRPPASGGWRAITSRRWKRRISRKEPGDNWTAGGGGGWVLRAAEPAGQLGLDPDRSGSRPDRSRAGVGQGVGWQQMSARGRHS